MFCLHRVFKREIVKFIKSDVQLQQDEGFKIAKDTMVDENLLKDKADIYGGLEPEQAFKKYLDTYADTDEIWAEFIIVYATPYFLGKPIYITQHQTLKQFEEAKNRTPEQAMESYKNQPKWKHFPIRQCNVPDNIPLLYEPTERQGHWYQAIRV